MSNKRKMRTAPAKGREQGQGRLVDGNLTFGHRQVEIQHPEQGPVEVDEGIAELIESLWATGIDTVESCEDVGNGRFMLAFPAAASQGFADRVFGGDTFRPGGFKFRGAHPDGSWKWGGFPHSRAGSPCKMVLTVIIPKADRVELIRRVRCGVLDDRYARLYEASDDGAAPRFEVQLDDKLVVFEDGTVLMDKGNHHLRFSATDEDRRTLELFALDDDAAHDRPQIMFRSPESIAS